MVQKIEIIVEQFENGISINTKDLDGNNETKKVAKTEEINNAIGKEIWAGIEQIFDETLTEKVRLNIRAEAIKI